MSAVPPPAETSVTLLGTGSPLPTAQHAGPATLVQAGDAVFLVDCGGASPERVAGAAVVSWTEAARNERRGKAPPKGRPGG